MTKDTSPGSQVGGPKKFLYGGPSKRQGFDNDEVTGPTFNYNYHSNTRKQPESEKFNVDGIWGLKDLAVPKPHLRNAGRRGDTESWDLNVGKTYYSRHGNSERANEQNSPKRSNPTTRKNLESTSQKSFTNSTTSNTHAKTWHSHMQTFDNTKDTTFNF